MVIHRTVSGSGDIGLWLAYAGDPELALEALNTVVDAYKYSSAQIWTYSDADVTQRLQWRPLMREVRRLPGFKDLVRKLGVADYCASQATGVITAGQWGKTTLSVNNLDDALTSI